MDVNKYEALIYLLIFNNTLPKMSTPQANNKVWIYALIGAGAVVATALAYHLISGESSASSVN
jgi:hypothetical protein